MNEAQKQRLGQLEAMSSADLTEADKKELAMLRTIERMEKQIIEKDSMIGKRDTELDNLKKASAQASAGKEKDEIEDRIKEKEEALEIAKAGLQALKEAQETNLEIAKRISSNDTGYKERVDPAEIIKLKKLVKADPAAKEKMDKALSEMTDAERNNPVFIKQCLEQVVSVGEKDAASFWDDVDEPEGAPQKSAEDRLKELFSTQVSNGRRLPPGISGLPGHPGAGTFRKSSQGFQRPVDDSPE
jgi:vacuolar-type H+-ATPase subunit I/STV1